jgi:glycosyltransferase involved in cell wall biosynthesis
MRILQLIPSLHVGGAERMAALLAGGLAQLGHQVGVVCLFDPVSTWIEADLRSAGIQLYFLGKRPGLDLKMIPRLGRVLAAFKPDILHTHLHTLKYALPARLAWPRGRVVHTVHNLARHEVEPQSQWIQQVAFRTGVISVAIGDAVAKSIEDLYGISPTAIIPNGIPVAACQAPVGSRASVRQEFSISEACPIFLTVGRLNSQKNHSALLSAFAALSSIDARLWIAGEGECREALGQQARLLNIADRVQFLGLRKDIPNLLAAADIFVLASNWEGNPLVVMEAMAAGRPVIATAVGCVPELVSAQSGRCVPAGDVPALTAAMQALSTDLAQARLLGIAGAEIARQRFDVSVMAKAYANLYTNRLRRS